jgi:hypothetical protein
VRGVILVNLENASFHMVYTINWFKKCSISITVLTLSNCSSDDKLVLFLFPGIPTSDPAIVAFYDKRIYKKLRLKELSLLSDFLYHGNKQHRNMTK